MELLILLSVAAVIVFIALPTLKPSDMESQINFAKDQLQYLYDREQAYYSRYGTYVPLSKVASDPEVGLGFDQRFATDAPEVNGVKFQGPVLEGLTFEIVATLPDGTRYRIDQGGIVTAQQ